MPDQHQFIYYASYLAFPVLVWLLWRLRRRRARIGPALMLTLVLVFVWARFIEPQWIRVQRTSLAGTGVRTELALISDTHLGVYKDRAYLQRLVNRINTLPVDAVLIAGDLTYEPRDGELDALFAPLAQLNKPVYAVLGNHDQQKPGPDIDVALRAALRQHGVRVIEGQIVQPVAGAAWRLAGLGDNWAGKDDPAFLKHAPGPLPTIVLAHNPDSAMGLSSADSRLLLAGHTHGGQIRIPGLYTKVIPSRYGFDRGEQFASTPAGPVRVFTTAGTGEVGLPMRLLNPPTIDWLSLRP